MTTPLRRSSPHEDKEIGTDADAAPLSALYRDLKLNIEYLPIERLENYPTNPHTHPPKQMKPLEGSIDAFGIVAPILIDEDDTVIGLSLIHISEPTRQAEISYAVFCL